MAGFDDTVFKVFEVVRELLRSVREPIYFLVAPIKGKMQALTYLFPGADFRLLKLRLHSMKRLLQMSGQLFRLIRQGRRELRQNLFLESASPLNDLLSRLLLNLFEFCFQETLDFVHRVFQRFLVFGNLLLQRLKVFLDFVELSVDFGAELLKIILQGREPSLERVRLVADFLALRFQIFANTGEFRLGLIRERDEVFLMVSEFPAQFLALARQMRRFLVYRISPGIYFFIGLDD